MKIISLLSDLIVESSRFEVLFDKYVKPKEGNRTGLMDFNTLLTLILADPDTKVPQNMNVEEIRPQDMDKIKIGKYSQWLIKNFVFPKLEQNHPLMVLDPESGQYRSAKKEYEELFLEDLYKVTEDLTKFERFKNRLPEEFRDINKLTPELLYDLVSDFSLEKTKATKEEKTKAAETYEHPGSEIVFRGNNWTVAKISDNNELGKDAACFYGGYHLEPKKGETVWCTSSPGLSYFESYIKQGPLYVIIPNKSMKFTSGLEYGEKSRLPALRYQFHFPSNQFMDPNDRRVDVVKLLNGELSELKEFFKPMFFGGGLEKSFGDKVQLTYSGSNNRDMLSMFVAVYGLDEIFNSLPKTVTALSIENTTGESIAIDVPSTLGSFTELRSIYFKNMIKSLPDEIGNLSKLNTISLLSNPKLTKLPESMGNLEELSILVLKGSPVGIPKSLEERVMTAGDGIYFLD